MNNAIKSALLLIDAQNDFCDPNGALYVPGAERDMMRVAERIRNKEFSSVFYTLDTHDRRAIFHPSWFKDPDGNPPAPFTSITAEDVESGRWIPQYSPEYTLEYLKALKKTHTIWPEHCIAGTWGHGLYPPVAEALKEVDFARHHIKGNNPYSEHYGAFEAEYVVSRETSFSETLVQELALYDKIYFAGEAKSHCVAVSLHQWLTGQPLLATKTYVLTDCMSDVPGYSAEETYELARAAGVVFV
jgi:nicotinamidase-related amidase